MYITYHQSVPLNEEAIVVPTCILDKAIVSQLRDWGFKGKLVSIRYNGFYLFIYYKIDNIEDIRVDVLLDKEVGE